MQNKQAIIGIVAAAIILVGAGVAYLYNKNIKSTTPESNSISAPKEKKGSEINSIIALIKSGKTQTCTFSYNDPDNNSTSGTAYLSGDKMKVEMEITTEDEKSTLNMLRLEDENYIWGSTLPNKTGIKLTITDDELLENGSKDYFDVSKEGDYDCSDWTENSLTFEVPTDVKFSEIPDIMQDALKDAKITVPPTR